MAENPTPPPSNRVVIESYAQDALAQMAETNKAGMDAFGKQLSRVVESIESLEAKLPRAIAEAVSKASRGGGEGTGGPSPNASVATTIDYTPEGRLMSEREWVAGQGPGGFKSPQQAFGAGYYSRFASRATVEASGFDSREGYMKAAQDTARAYSGAPPATPLESVIYGRMGVSPTASVASSTQGGWFQKRFDGQKYTTQDYGNLSAGILQKGAQFAESRGNVTGANNAKAVGNLVSYMSDKYAGPMDMAKDIIAPHIQRGQDRTALGTAFGGNPQTGDIEGPFGFGRRMNIPFINDATTRGLALQGKALFDARAAGINKDQVGGIMSGLGALGYKPNTNSMGGLITDKDNRFNRLLATQESLFRRDPNLVNPLEERMLDRGTRFDDTDESLKTLRKAFLGMADTSNRTQLSIAQLQSAADSYGKFIEGQGGTFAQGVAQSGTFSAATGLPGDVFEKAQQNSLVKANQMVSSGGLAPWQLGNLTIGERMKSMYDTFGQIEGMARQGPETRTDPITGETVTVPSDVLTRQNMRMFLPDFTTQEIKMIQKNKEMNLGAADIMSSMDMSYVSGGDQSHWDAMNEKMKSLGFTDEQRAQIHDAGSVDTEEGRQKQRDEFEKVWGEKNADIANKLGIGGEDGQGTKVKIELTDEARRYLRARQEGAKAESNGGGEAIVQTILDAVPGGDIIGGLLK